MYPPAHPTPLIFLNASTQQAAGNTDKDAGRIARSRRRECIRAKRQKAEQKKIRKIAGSVVTKAGNAFKSIVKKEPLVAGTQNCMSKDERRIQNRASVQNCRKRKKERVGFLANEYDAVRKEHPILRGILAECAALFEEIFTSGLLSREHF